VTGAICAMVALYAVERIVRCIESGKFRIRINHIHVSDVPLETVEEKYDGGVPTQEQIQSHIMAVNEAASKKPVTRTPFGGTITTKRRKS